MLRNTLQWNLKGNINIFIQENVWNVICKRPIILSRPQCDTSYSSLSLVTIKCSQHFFYKIAKIGKGELWGVLCEFEVHTHDDVVKWKHFLHYWSFVRGIHWSPVNSPHKGQWRQPLMFSFICAWTIKMLVIWDTIALIMTSLQCLFTFNIAALNAILTYHVIGLI